MPRLWRFDDLTLHVACLRPTLELIWTSSTGEKLIVATQHRYWIDFTDEWKQEVRELLDQMQSEKRISEVLRHYQDSRLGVFLIA